MTAQAILPWLQDRPWTRGRAHLAAPLARAAWVALPPVPPPVGGAADAARRALGRGGQWPVPVLDLPCAGEEEDEG